MPKVIELKKNITTLGWLNSILKEDDYLFLLKTLEDLLYLAILEAQAIHEHSEGQGAYRLAAMNIYDHNLTKLEFAQKSLNDDSKQRQLANLATIGAIAKQRANLVVSTRSYQTNSGANLLVSIHMKDFACSSHLNQEAILAYKDGSEDANELISWSKMAQEMMIYQDYLLPMN